MILETDTQVHAITSRKKEKKIPTVILVLGFVLILVAVAYFGGKKLYAYYTSAPSTDSKTYPFVVTKGETAAEIGQRLTKSGFVRSNLAFRLWVKKENLTLQAGEYIIGKNKSLSDLALILTHGTFDVQVTFLEGWRREQVIAYLFDKDVLPNIVCVQCAVSKDAAMAKVFEQFFSQTKEGYVFPDTYTLPKYSSLDELLHFVNENFWSKYTPELQDETTKNGMTVDEVINLASIVEREVKTAADRELVAGILLKRLTNDWPLGADATLQYAKATKECAVNSLKCDWWPKDLTTEDLEMDSAYNTRKNTGLPPTAICNPSLSAIKAVLKPKQSDYWYYLSDTNGLVHYAKTIEEHNQNVAKYL